MALHFTDIVEEARLTARAVVEYGAHLVNPTVRLGVTGLSRAGKTVFVTALVHGIVRGGRLPVFEALASGRIAGARLSPQPDDAVPRFDYERHLHDLIVPRAGGRNRRSGSANCGSRSTTSRRAVARARSHSTLSIIPANGCSICRCSTYELRVNGRRRR
jgi:hypothetical protein